MHDDTTPDYLAQWQERREKELTDSVQRIQEGLLPTEPQRWEIEQARVFHHNMLCQEYEELWDDFCNAKKALLLIAGLDEHNADFAIGLAAATLEELNKCK